MGDFLPWVPIGTLSGGHTKSPSKAAGRVLGAEGAPEQEVLREQEQARRALLDKAHEERRADRLLSQQKQQQAKTGEASLRAAAEAGNGN